MRWEMAQHSSIQVHPVSPVLKALAQPVKRGGFRPLSLSMSYSLITPQYRIDQLFLDKSTPETAYRLETFRSTGSISATASQQLRCYFVTKCNFPSNSLDVKTDERTDIKKVSDSAFLDRATKNTLDIYQEVISDST